MTKTIVAACALLAASLPGFPQMGPEHGGPRHDFGDPFGDHMHHAKLVLDAPYTATMSNQSVQHLQDGDTVQRTTSGQVARDRQGRTYEQVTITGGRFGQTGTKTLTFITDPVAGYSYTLDATTKTAMQRPLPPSRTDDSNARDNGKGSNHPNRPNVTEADLGADSSSGVAAEGKSFTRTIPAGSMGNSQPIVSTTQTWYSADLQIVVKSVRTDPMFGTSTYALTNVVQKDPDESLFKVPAWYTTKTDDHHRGGPGGAPER